MKKKTILIPENTKYIGNWKDYVMPAGHCIVDKGITGCGYTEMCLRNDLNVILCSPRRLLLENKADQHEADENILYLENNIKVWEEDKPKFEEMMNSHINKCRNLGKAIKFMIVYDSAKYLIDFLSTKTTLLNSFYVVADEFQSIFLDSFFKADVENSFLKDLQICPNVIYLSATPMLDKYLEQVDEFKSLPMEILDWSQSGFIETIRLQSRRTSSLSVEADKIIENYLKGEFPTIIDSQKIVHQSKEAVMFFNSVTEITRLIKRHKLTPEQCNIICTKSNSDQVKKVERLGKGWSVGKIPKQTETNKMFTFCTSSCYIGSDFYSKCASTYVFADPNLECLALDISLDLPQIAGRQRDRDNPFKNIITIFYKTLRDEKIDDKEKFKKLQEQRRKNTEGLLMAYNEITSEENKALFLEKINCGIELMKYSKDFIGIDKKNGLPVYNKFIELANERAFEVIQEDYQTSINVTKTLENACKVIVSEYKDQDDKLTDDFLNNKFYKTNIFAEKMKLFCEFMDNVKDNEYIKDILLRRIPDPRFLSYYNFLGTAGCRAISYKEDLILDKVKNYLNKDVIMSELCKNFMLGDKLDRKEIKSRLSLIFSKLNLKRTAKASDLNEWFEIKDIMMTDANNKRVHGFEIIALKRQDN